MNTNSIEVIPVKTKKDLNNFIKLPWKIYKNDPQWVPPLISQLKANLDKNKHPFFEHSEADFFIAERGKQTVGTIAAILNNRHNEVHNENVGFFGFFETIKDYEVAEKLLARAMEWGAEKKLDCMRGPENYSQNDPCGLLIDGFETPPAILMTHNPKYYQDFIKRYGFTKAMDLWAWQMNAKDTEIPERVKKVVKRIKERSKVTFRKISKKHLDTEIELVKQVYNNAWEKNWGFVPMTEREIEHTADELKDIVDEDIVFFAELDGKPIGFSLACPDFNQALIKLNGRLFPFGIFKLLWHARKINRARVIIMGVIPEYRSRGIDSVFYLDTYENAVAKGYTWGEFSWILETNDAMNTALKNIGAEIYKTYRIFEKKIIR
ncbi:N-acetyltransferase [candidate division KSB1 bacterium]|nr:N-acetyltransferase [candidate division KSB1 bacterium]MBL7093386.1 N-acetyltransferase [candidate division KSB1 bacterium]